MWQGLFVIILHLESRPCAPSLAIMHELFEYVVSLVGMPLLVEVTHPGTGTWICDVQTRIIHQETESAYGPVRPQLTTWECLASSLVLGLPHKYCRTGKISQGMRNFCVAANDP